MDELRALALRAELADLRALVVTMQPSELLPTGQLLVQAPDLSSAPGLVSQDQLSAAPAPTEPIPDQFEVVAEVDVDPLLLVLVREPELHANHAELLERLRGGGRLVHRGQQFEELNANGTQRGRVDRRTVKSLVNSKRLQEIGGTMHLTPAAVAQLGTRSTP